ncbi:LolA family protein [Curvivirga aplysinae]|uniref:LolA family protein n=1 Tax=Curvivirga aplysinae TaxID=2529852 RepID=UPI0012BC356A|nr:hypothetical protein [Curvivirga aplysinae]MTI11027.1 hypothetical protein [Curvivirga aplysinae]
MRLILVLFTILLIVPIGLAQANQMGSRIAFLQHKWLSGMDQPIKSEGYLSIYPSDIIYWQVTFPFETEMLISETNIIQFVAKEKSMEVPISQLPFLQSIRSLLLTLDSQDIKEEISKTYQVELLENEAGWIFALPTQKLKNTPFDLIRFNGQKNMLSSVYMKRKTGDREEIQFGEIELLPLSEMPSLPEPN